jgi:YihY family inner membrane protein
MTVLVSTLRSLAEEVPEIARARMLDWLSWTFLVGGGFVLAVVVFFLVYKLMPDRKVLWTEALSGSLLSATLWEIASYIFGKLVPHFDYARVYGTMGAIIAVISWVYTSALILLIGGHFSARLHAPDLEQAKLFSPDSIDRAGPRNGGKIRVLSRHRR